MKKFLAIGALAITSIAFGQQSFLTSQYTQNMYLLNPAAAGLSNDVDINLGHRSQWVGFENAPTTYYLSANSLLGKNPTTENIFSLRISEPSITTEDGYELTQQNTVVERKVRHAVGGVLYRDEAGAFNRTVGAASYAVHIPVGAKSSLSAGIRLGVNNTAFDANLANVRDQSDAFYTTFANGNSSVSKLDGSIGLFYYTPKFYAGYSVDQIFGNTLDYSDQAEAKLVSHHLINAGLRIDLSENVGLTPSVLVRATSGAPTSFDINGKIDYLNKYYFGIGVRPEDAVIIMAGLNITNKLTFGYSYDITTSNINTVSSGTHEFVLGIALSK